MDAMPNKPVVLLLVEGFGLSSSWQGNAIASAKPVNFDEIWRNFYHLPLLPFGKRHVDKSFFLSPDGVYRSLSDGIRPRSNRELVSSAITAGLIDDNSGIKLMCDSLIRKNGALHLIGSVSKEGEVGEIEQLIAILKSIKNSGVARVYLHILIDQSYNNVNEIKSKIGELERSIAKYDFCEIATISGLTSVPAEPPTNYLKLVCSNKTRGFNDIIQALNAINPLVPADTLPMRLLSSRDSIIKDFDSVLFFDHTAQYLASVMSALLSEPSDNSRSKIRYLEIYSLLDFPHNPSEQIHFLLNKSQSKGRLLRSMADAGLKTRLIAQSDRLAAVSYYLCGKDAADDVTSVPVETGRKYLSEWRKVLRSQFAEISEGLKSGRADFLIANISTINNICHQAGFSESVEAVGVIDKYLGNLADLALEKNATLIFSSPFGMAEQMVANSSNKEDNYKCIATPNPVPLVVVSSGSRIANKKTAGGVTLMNEMIEGAHDLSFLHNLIMLLFGINNT